MNGGRLKPFLERLPLCSQEAAAAVLGGERREDSCPVWEGVTASVAPGGPVRTAGVQRKEVPPDAEQV